MAFNKSDYWAAKPFNIGSIRNRVKRPKISLGTRDNRAQRRLKFRARFYFGLKDTVGKTFTKKGVIGRNGKIPFIPTQNLNETNHERVVRQRSLRKALRGVK